MSGDFLAAFHHEFDEVLVEVERSQSRYGDFASTHEALGVLLEEVNELGRAVQANALESVRGEAMQVAAVAVRFALHCRDHAAFAARSRK
jgi:NTP pyrophosphatase (non-canonical NTP hydrolase)